MIDPSLMKVLMEAWERVRPVLDEDPGELAARRGRRRMAVMRQPQRAWCLAVRAMDTRISGMDFEMVPDRPQVWDHEARCWRYREHTVVLESGQLRWLCRPVSIPFPGVTSRELAGMLGVNLSAVNRAMKRGTFSINRVAGLGGVKGPPVPILYTKSLLDPAGIPLGRMADVEWGSVWKWVSEHVPDGIRQTLVRRPMFKASGGGMDFNGWRWVCPGCGGNARLMFYPLGAMEAAPFVKTAQSGSPDDLEAPPPCFACSTCHGVHDRGRVDHIGWNELVAQLSGGLLYGREVKRPNWYVPQRKRAYHRQRRRAPSKRKAEVEELLVKTKLKKREIAAELGVGVNTIIVWAVKIYKERGVHSREELRRVVSC